MATADGQYYRRIAVLIVGTQFLFRTMNHVSIAASITSRTTSRLLRSVHSCARCSLVLVLVGLGSIAVAQEGAVEIEIKKAIVKEAIKEAAAARAKMDVEKVRDAAGDKTAEATAAEPGVSPQIAVLARYDLQPTSESLIKYFDAMQPSPERRTELEQHIRELGSESFAARETAMKLLMRQPAGLHDVLVSATKSDDPEIRWRSKRILDQTQAEGRSLLFAALTIIREENLPGLASSLLKSLPLCDEEHLRIALRRALIATATTKDLPMLVEGLSEADPQYRIAVLGAIAELDTARSVELSLKLLSDDAPIVRATSARILAVNNRRESLPTLVKLLDADDVAVRLEAFRTLRSYTGEAFGFTVYAPKEERSAPLEKWNEWLEKSSSTAILKHPLDNVPIDLGRILVTNHGQNKVIEFDVTGKKLWERATGVQPWACQGLPNGHRLIGSFNERSLVEYDDTGKEVWRYDGLPGGPTSVERLENGNTLIACTEGSQVLEIDPAKKIVWKAALEGRPVDARRLEDGRTLVALQNVQKVIEIDASGKTVWEIGGVGMPFSVQRLENGNTLVCSLNLQEIREYSRDGKVVWQQGKFKNPYSAQRLATGTTVVVDSTGVTEIDAAGKELRKIDMPALSRAWRF